MTMQTFYEALRAAYAERVQTTTTGISVGLADGTTFILETPPPRLDARLQALVLSVVTAYVGLVADTQRVTRDGNLSEAGKAAALTKPRESSLRIAAEFYAGLLEYEAAVDAGEARRYAPPAVPKTPSELSVALARHREIRDLVRGREAPEVMALLERAADAAITGDAEAREFVTAVLTPTFGDLTPPQEYARTLWRRLVNLEDPQGFIEIEDARAGIDWTRRALYALGAHIRRVARLADDVVLGFVYASRGAAVFGFTDARVELAARQAEFDKQRQRGA
jgi:hypothetical protein